MKPDEAISPPTRPTLIEFCGIPLMAFAAEDGQLYVSLRPICHQLGLHFPSEMRRVRAMAALAEGLRELDLDNPGSDVHKTPCLKVDLVSGWLIGINTRQVTAPVLRQKLLAYQQEVSQVAWQIFGPTLAIELELAALASKVDRLAQRLEAISKSIGSRKASG
jgi:hypothetical protein